MKSWVRAAPWSVVDATTIAAAAAIALVGMNSSVLSMEGGQSPALKGYRDFLAGVLPSPGVQIRTDTYFYNGTERSTIPQGQLRVDVKARTQVLGLTVITPYQMFGANYAVAVRAAGSNIDVNQTISRPGVTIPRSGNLTGFNDIVLTPAILGWHSGNLHWNLATSVWLPAGDYDKTRTVNTGRNYWAVSPQFGITYFDPKTGWDISAALMYGMNGTNTATNYRSGNIGHFDYAVGKHLTRQFKVGVVGYVVQQLTADGGSGATLGPRKLRIAGIGPAATINFQVSNVPVTLVAKYYREFDAQNTTQGDAGSFSMRVKF